MANEVIDDGTANGNSDASWAGGEPIDRIDVSWQRKTEAFSAT